MSRKAKKPQDVVQEVPSVEEITPVVVETTEEPAQEPVKIVSGVNVDELKALLYKNDLEAMQEAVAKVQGDELTMNAVQSVLDAKGTGIASQFLQQIIQRNS
jgi:hypothetical protein